MDKSFAMIVALVCAAMLLKALTGSGGKKSAPLPVAKRFMTARELAVLDALERCLPEYRFHAQVAMGALLKAPPRLVGKTTPADRNAFSQKIVDFVAQDRATGAIVALIEVDDSSHDANRDRQRDAMTADAGYRTIRIGRAVQPKVDEVRMAVAALFQPSVDNRGRA